MNLKSRIAALICFCLLLGWAVPAGAAEVPQERYYRARVLGVKESGSEQAGGIEQELLVEIKSGPFKGEIITILNYYMPGRMLFDLQAREGMEVVIVAFGDGSSLNEVYLHDLARDRGVYYLIAIFLAAMLLLGRAKGLKTIVSLCITGALIVKFLLPNLLRGHNPIILAVVTAALVIITTLLLVGGINLKSLAAILGTITGVVAAGILALWVGNISSLTGFSTQEAQSLYVLMDKSIDIRGLLFAGIIIGSLGAITDIGISVASAAAEIKEANPGIQFKELTAGALNVGRDVLGTMANTLILAYVGAATPLLLLVVGHGMPWLKLVNLDLIATEFVRGIAGTVGLIAAVPVTALLSGYLLSRREYGGFGGHNT